MKVLLINGSPRINGCTARALKEVVDTLENNGIETETIHVGNKDIRGCIGCMKCRETGKCVFNDIVNETMHKFEQADGLVVGTPVYFASANSTLVAYLTRLFYASPFDKTMKVGAAISSARRAGTVTTMDELNKFFSISGMPIVSSQYWNEVHGYNAKQVEEDLEGLQIMRTLGKNMAFLIKAIHAQKEKEGLPEKEERLITNFIK